MNRYDTEVQLSKIEKVFVVGFIGCMLFATWELGHLIADDWFREWVRVDHWVRARLIKYGIAFLMSMSSIWVTTKYAFSFKRFGQTVSTAFLWYGTLLLLSTIAIFIFDCLPEVVAGLGGAAVFITAIYSLQKRYFSTERVSKKRLYHGKCMACEGEIGKDAIFCPHCGIQLGEKCGHCSSIMKVVDKYCSACGKIR